MGHLYVLILNIITQYASFPFIPTPPMYSILSLFSHSVPKAEEISRKMGWKDYNRYNSQRNRKSSLRLCLLNDTHDIPQKQNGCLSKIRTKIAQIDLLNGGEGSEYKIKDWRKLRDVKRKTFYFFLDFYSIWENGPFIFPRKILVYYVFYC